jgi:hypothetical protein
VISLESEHHLFVMPRIHVSATLSACQAGSGSVCFSSDDAKADRQRSKATSSPRFASWRRLSRSGVFCPWYLSRATSNVSRKETITERSSVKESRSSLGTWAAWAIASSIHATSKVSKANFATPSNSWVKSPSSGSSRAYTMRVDRRWFTAALDPDSIKPRATTYPARLWRSASFWTAWDASVAASAVRRLWIATKSAVTATATFAIEMINSAERLMRVGVHSVGSKVELSRLSSSHSEEPS